MATKKLTLENLQGQFETMAENLRTLAKECTDDRINPSKMSGADAFRLGTESKSFFETVEELVDALEAAADLADACALDAELARTM